MHSVNWFCFCRSLTIDFMAHVAAVQCVVEQMVIEKEQISDFASCLLKSLFTCLGALQPCGAIYEGIGWTKDGAIVYCYQPRNAHSAHRTAVRLYGLPRFNKFLKRTATDHWGGDYLSNCDEEPSGNEHNRFILLTRDYALKLTRRHHDISVVHEALTVLFLQSIVFTDDWENTTHNFKLRFNCLCCLQGVRVSKCGICLQCNSNLAAYSEKMTDIGLLVMNTPYALYSDCVICIMGKRNCCLLPCGHRAFCENCAEKIVRKFRLCPICRESAKNILKIIEV